MAFTSTKDNRFVWIDLETTGLEPKGGLILEAAVVLTDAQLRLIDSINIVVPHKMSTLNAALDDFTMKMHTDNGLIKDIAHLNRFGNETGDIAHTILDSEIVGFLQSHDVGKIPMCGSSVAFDRNWVNEHLTMTAQAFHYRNIDVSSMLEAIARINPHMIPNVPQIGTAHRAMGDIQTTIETLRVIAKISGWSYSA